MFVNEELPVRLIRKENDKVRQEHVPEISEEYDKPDQAQSMFRDANKGLTNQQMKSNAQIYS